MIAFDIETGPLAGCMDLMPDVQPPPHPGEFDAGAVKLGNLKDATKIAEKIDAAREKHDAAVRDHESDCESAMDRAEADWLAKAALDPTTGRVLAIGYQSADEFSFDHDDADEASLLFDFWGRLGTWCNAHRVCGFNSRQFDLPFLFRRSIILGVTVPQTLLRFQGRYLNWHTQINDLRDIWLCGQQQSVHPASLDFISRSLGGKGKTKGVSGADFARLWRDDRKEAIEYMQDDMAATWLLAISLFPLEK